MGRTVPPAPSPEQTNALADAEVGESEYHAQFDRSSQGMTAAGHPVESVDKSGEVITYNTSGASVTSGAEGRCYAQHFG